jgi:tol-pal system protein YbgF
MTNKVSLAVLGVAIAIAVVTPADAANKEHQQLMADLRMLQEQAQLLQNTLGALTSSVTTTLAATVTSSMADAFKPLNARLDDQMNVSRKALADQKLVVDNLSNDVRVIREKLDDNNVRIGSLMQEVESLRQALQQMPPPRAAGAEPARSAASAPTAPPPPPAPIPGGLSPQKLWDAAYADYTAGQYDLAVQGFEMYIKSFPKSDMTDNAQVSIGNAYLNDGKAEKALEAYEKAIRSYANADSIPDAYYKKGLALQNLKDLEGARQAWEYCVKTFPDSDAGRQAKQRLDQLLRRP